MAYHLDAEKINLDELRARIEATDLVPSRVALLEGIGAKFRALKGQGIATLAELRVELRNSRRLESMASLTGIDSQYLVLLRREIESYFPKPFPLKDFIRLPAGEIARLNETGIRNSAELYAVTRTPGQIAELAESSGVDRDLLETLSRLVDLTRIQWTSPTAARMLLEAGYESSSLVANADPEGLCDALVRVNEGGRFFKGNIGLQDIKRLVMAAGYISE